MTVYLEQSDNNLVHKLPAIVGLQDDGGSEEGEDLYQLLCSLLGRLSICQKIHVV